MVKYREIIFIVLISCFLFFSFSPTIFQLSQKGYLGDVNREFILEHNYYWPDYNLYLSKIRQGFEGQLLAYEKYTSEKHTPSLIQEFYVVLGHIGRLFDLDPSTSYHILGRALFSFLLLILLVHLSSFYFKGSWQILAFIIIVVSGSFPKFFIDNQGALHIGRYMEWWTNIDALQRITFIPHILAGQILSFFLLHQITNKSFDSVQDRQKTKNYVFLIILGNILGLIFPPSLITLDTVLLLLYFMQILHTLIFRVGGTKGGTPSTRWANTWSTIRVMGALRDRTQIIILQFIIFSLPSLLYIFILTKQIPWSALITTHKLHPSPIPFTDYILGTGPIFFFGLLGAIVSIIQRRKEFQPLIFWVLTTFGFAIFFTYFREQSPLRFTQTGLFIPLGILGAYFFYQLFHLSYLSRLSNLGRRLWKTGFVFILLFYLFLSLTVMKVSYDWQINWITQLIKATHPAVPSPPQAMLPLTDWMKAVRWLRDNTNHNEVVLGEVTASNYIPAYAGNFVYFGQANTYEYERKADETDKFFRGKMTQNQAELFLKQGRITYIFVGPQEQDKLGRKKLEEYYPFLKSIYTNARVTLYR